MPLAEAAYSLSPDFVVLGVAIISIIRGFRLLVLSMARSVQEAVVTWRGNNEMGTFSVDLPFALTLQESNFPAVVQGESLVIQHRIVEHEYIDQRLGEVPRKIGFRDEDPAGLLRYSRLSFQLDSATIQRLEHAFFSDLLQQRGTTPTMLRAQVAVAICNHFLDIYRATSFKSWVSPIGTGTLTRVRYTDSHNHEDLGLYGGGTTLAPVGLTMPVHQTFMQTLAKGEEPPRYRLEILDALRAGQRGIANGALITAIGALETALDAYFAARWRGATPVASIASASADVSVTRKSGVNTLDDVLRAGNLGPKLDSFCIFESVAAGEKAGVMRCIDARNDAVHGGIAVPAPLARTLIATIGDFLDHQVGPRTVALPKSPRARILDAYIEATGAVPPQALQIAVQRCLITQHLDAIMFSDHPKSPVGTMANYYGRTMVAIIPFQDHAFKNPDHVALILARMMAMFSIRAVGIAPRARVGRLPGPLRPLASAYDRVASEITKAVWETAVDQQLSADGMATAISIDIANRELQLRKMFAAPYTSPPTLSAAGFLEHVELARVAASLGIPRGTRLIQNVAQTAPNAAARARRALASLDAVDLHKGATLRAALIELHDSSDMLYGSVEILDPASGMLYGDGLTPNPQPA